ncbi:Shikimate kinase I [hydrothermal vent metagenome]|uniref:shikimate kinase n=1 Tax=hydrothermal vent metagenome TaxID=652676 RepID=A0A3B1E2X4_9ZZZZ
MTITLIGYRGSGKSSIAPLIATRLGWQWADVDRLIEKKADKTIKDIFEQEGEPAFREIEREVVSELFQKKQMVIATGGGTVLSSQNRDHFIQGGPVIWLKASVEGLFERISKDPISEETRPSLTSKGGGIEEIQEVLQQREPFYKECATIKIETENHTFDSIVKKIMQQLPNEITAGENQT